MLEQIGRKDSFYYRINSERSVTERIYEQSAVTADPHMETTLLFNRKISEFLENKERFPYNSILLIPENSIVTIYNECQSDKFEIRTGCITY